MLTLKMLKDMPPATVFATGVINDPRIYKESVRWVAKRGGIHDWAIYYHHERYSQDYVMENGDKMITKEVIKELVPCDDEAYSMYRF